MTKIMYPKEININLFSRNVNDPEVKYGMPKEVQFCKSCVISNQRPTSAVEFKHTKDSPKSTIGFDGHGICDACRHKNQKAEAIDWNDRERRLIELCDQHRREDGQYDCVVPGSGGKDSFYAAHILKYKYNMHPITVTWAPHIYTDWGWRNFQRWINAGFDNLLVTPNGRIHRLLTRLAVDILFHPFQAFMLGQKNLAPKTSILYNIPLVFFGENEAEYGNPVQENEQAVRDWKYFTAENKSNLYIGGVSIDELKSEFGVSALDLAPYLPAQPDKLERTKTEVHYLGYYLKWHPQTCYYYAQEHGGFEPSPERTTGTYSKYNSIDDRIDDFHYYTTFIKFGIGRATYDAAQEARSEDITREEGVALVKRYDGEFPDRFADEIFKYLSIYKTEFPKAYERFEQPVMDRAYFQRLTDQFRSPHLWRYENDEWALRKTVWASDK